MDIPSHSLDNVFKESLSLFKDKTLDFLGLTGIAPITEHLGAESVQIDVTWELNDLVFATQDGRGLLLEEESNLSKDDLFRFIGYNVSMRRAHKREFLTVVFVKNPTNITTIESEQLNFAPIIVQCSKIDADEILAELRQAVDNGQPINELSAIYLPLFHSTQLSPTELFVKSASVIRAMDASDSHKQKVLALLITLAGNIVDKVALDALAEEVILMGNKFIEYFEERGEKRGEKRGVEQGELRGREIIAKNLIRMGHETGTIAEATGFSPELIDSLRSSMQVEAV